MKKIDSLTIFFPFYNDEGTVIKQIQAAYKVGSTLTDDLEVIALHGGNSKDATYKKILEAKDLFPELRIVDKKDNKEGYAVIKHGFLNATKSWIFYTDGDAQYSMDELPSLVNAQLESDADVVNGYKTRRGDGFVRYFLGDMYARFSRFIFELPIRDTDCDFRLVRKSYMDQIELLSTDSSILGELIKKLELVGAKFVEVPVSHFDREYGSSNYTPFDLFREKLIGDIKLYFKLKKLVKLGSGLRIIKFSLVGFSSIAIQIILFNILMQGTSLHATAATILADQLAIINSFILNNHFTFKDRKHIEFLPISKAFGKFYLVVMTTTLIQALIVYLGTRTFGETLYTSNFFFILGLGLTFFLNYKFQKNLVWFK
jgi:putative flippase GtrA